ncbi:MAG: glycosyltransferase [Gemmatimonadaceae bacterium]
MSIVIIWFGYPLAVGALAAVFGRSWQNQEPQQGHVSVIIATRDSAEVVRERVRDLLESDYPPELLQVVVALDPEGALSPTDLRSTFDERVVLVTGEAPGGKACNLNAGVAASRGEILVFSDAAQRFERDTISRLVAALGDPRLGAVSGALHIGRDGAPANLSERYWILERWLRLQESRLHSAIGVTGAVYAMRRAAWHPLPAGLILDDVYAPMNLVLRGYRVGFEPRAVAYDERRFAPGQELRRKARTLTGVLQLCMWLPDVLVPWRNPVWLQFVFHKLLRLLTPYLLLGMALSLTIAAGQSLGAGRPMWSAGVVAAFVATLALVFAASRRLRAGVQMAAAMQVAMVRATINGLRGRWDVWSR